MTMFTPLNSEEQNLDKKLQLIFSNLGDLFIPSSSPF